MRASCNSFGEFLKIEPLLNLCKIRVWKYWSTYINLRPLNWVKVPRVKRLILEDHFTWLKVTTKSMFVWSVIAKMAFRKPIHTPDFQGRARGPRELAWLPQGTEYSRAQGRGRSL